MLELPILQYMDYNGVKGKVADLHLHSTYSDGILSVEELIKLAVEKNVSTISITDHDNIDSITELKIFGKQHNIDVINGVELSASFEGREVHILCYGFDETNSELLSYLQMFKQKRITRVQKMVEMFSDEGMSLTLEEVMENAPGTHSVGRPHIASALVSKGYAKNFHEAFHKFIGDKSKFYIRKENESVEYIINMIKNAGGVCSLAHPAMTFRGAELNKLLNCGFEGIEVVHPSHNKYSTNYFIRIAEEKGLIQTGGSDFHGKYDADYENIGKFYIPYYKIEKLFS